MDRLATQDDGLAIHGGDLDAVARRHGVPRDELVDFSANLNPLGPPPTLIEALAAAAADVRELARYPEPDAAALRRALGAHHGIDPAAIVIANGAAALIGVAARVAMRARCLVPQPAFSEDAHALRVAGITLVPIQLDPERNFALDIPAFVARLATGHADSGIVTTPHNPSGAVLERAALADLVARARHADATLVLDEAFVDFVPDATAIDLAAIHPQTIVVRSLTKFFAVPALRVGFAVCEPNLAAHMRAALPSWPVTTMAMRALAAALDDADYARRTRATIATERATLLAALRALGLRVFDASANFLLVDCGAGASVASLVARLVREHRIVVRDCTSYDGLAPDRYMRVAVRGAVDNAQLVAALAHVTGLR